VKVRILGSAGLASSALGLGTAAFTGVHGRYGPVSRYECVRTIQLALDIGVTMLDTADFYSHGDIERLLGESLSGQRDKVLIATHGGLRVVDGRASPVVHASPPYLARACNASLRRLKTDYIDIYYLSRVDPRVPLEESIGKLAELAAAGRIRRSAAGSAWP
jgi:aryl-alcohol dehydrogenase-like predicted oxidoreductase